MIRAALDAVRAYSGQMRSDAELAAGADAALRQAPAGLTGAGAASFLADKAQESAYHRTTTEYDSGNLRNADYWPYIGRSFQQITWKTRYGQFGTWCCEHGLVGDPDVFVDNPATLADYQWAWLGGTWYFGAFDLWRHANAGDHYAVSQGVNRGPGAIGTSKVPSHWTERKAMFDAYRRFGDDLLPDGAAPPVRETIGPDTIPTMQEGDVGAHVHRLAYWLNAWFPSYAATPIALDANPARQRYGPTTVRVIREFQSRTGVTGPDAVGTPVGPRTKRALWDVGYRP